VLHSLATHLPAGATDNDTTKTRLKRKETFLLYPFSQLGSSPRRPLAVDARLISPLCVGSLSLSNSWSHTHAYSKTRRYTNTPATSLRARGSVSESVLAVGWVTINPKHQGEFHTGPPGLCSQHSSSGIAHEGPSTSVGIDLLTPVIVKPCRLMQAIETTIGRSG
jgi:hypothetical protein